MRYPQHTPEIIKDRDPVRWLHDMADSAEERLSHTWSQLREHLPAREAPWPPEDWRDRRPLLQAIGQLIEVMVETQGMVADMREYVSETPAAGELMRAGESPCWQHADAVTGPHAEVCCDDCDAHLSTARCAGCGKWFVTGPHVQSWDDHLQCVPCWENMSMGDAPDA